MIFIKNRKELLSYGNREGKRIALDIIECALKAIDPYYIIKKKVFVDNNVLTVGQLKYDLSKIQNIYVVGAGKGTLRMAEALEDILGDIIKQGIIIEKRVKGHKNYSLKTIEIVEAGHPLPDERGAKGAEKVVKVAKRAQYGDLVFVCIAGGCSSLMPLPVEGISLEDKKRVNDQLLKCGATIEEINTVRKHISAIKGGRLAKLISPAEIINFLVIDEVAGLPWGPTVPDTTTFEDAIYALQKYDLFEKVPNSVKKHLEKGLSDPSLETPKPRDFEGLKVHNLVLADNNLACEAAKRKAEEIGFNSMILSTFLEGESREVGIVLACIAKEVEENGRPIKPPCVIILGGETTVTIVDEHGEGGRNQELALASSMKINGSEGIIISSIGTDGTDGPTNVAGGIVDGYTVERAKDKQIDIFMNLKKHNSSYALKQLKGAIFTGPTGTNVMDLTLVVITNQAS